MEQMKKEENVILSDIFKIQSNSNSNKFWIHRKFINSIRKKHHKKALKMCCKISGIAIVVMAIISDLL